MRQHFNGEPYLFDGFKIAYSKNMPIDIPDPKNDYFGVLHEGVVKGKTTQYMVMRINLALDEDKKGHLDEQSSSSSSSSGNGNGSGKGNGNGHESRKGNGNGLDDTAEIMEAEGAAWDLKEKGSNKDIHTCKIETAKVISMTSLEEYLKGTLKQYTDDCKEGMSKCSSCDTITHALTRASQLSWTICYVRSPATL